jgi:hypothetical protein
LRRFFCCQLLHEYGTQFGRNVSEIGCAVVVDTIISDQRGDAFLKRGRSWRKFPVSDAGQLRYWTKVLMTPWYGSGDRSTPASNRFAACALA